VLREVAVQSGKLLLPKEILFAREMRSQLFRDVSVKGRQLLVRREILVLELNPNISQKGIAYFVTLW